MMPATRSRSGAVGCRRADGSRPRRSAVRCSTAAQSPSMSPNWYFTAPQVAPMSLAMRLADTARGRRWPAPQRGVQHALAGRLTAPVGALRRTPSSVTACTTRTDGFIEPSVIL